MGSKIANPLITKRIAKELSPQFANSHNRGRYAIKLYNSEYLGIFDLWNLCVDCQPLQTKLIVG